MLSVLVILGLFTLLAPAFAQVTDPATLAASIQNDKNWSLLPKCINQCIWDNGSNDTPKIGGDIAEHLSCGSPWINGCFCRSQSATIAHSFITFCASYLCSTPAPSDIESGTAVYAQYCSSALGAAYTPDGVQQVIPAATTNSATPSPLPTTNTVKETGTGPITAGPTATPAPSSTNSNSNNNDNTNNTNKDDEKIAGLSKGAFIGVVVSCTCSVLGLLFGAGFKIYKHKKNTRLEKERIQQLQYHHTPKV
ncbi:hypothetical protein K505DRAFT_364566 [Melanomma pulvis-pyrius CBS 109.77]|uniref:Extracellular membrane protein CFEM domain-containing protein n=1 Tax=Melanomma pulvis-pyrius CBS 109.77 TaxID=1314802 RepID=A0A6A6X316_9PLEO|nr:hypothetical protein K505DRAFT_364566 [Melanomma pulvis-pyrius CBS 109.77]